MSELIVVMSADTADLVHFLFFFFTSAAWVATREAEIFTAVCRICRGAVTLDGALRDVAEPRHRSPPSSQRRTRRWEASAPLARPLRHGPCNCTGPHCGVVPGTSRCHHGAAQQDAEIQLEPTPKK
jgi:hypothetical protein